MQHSIVHDVKVDVIYMYKHMCIVKSQYTDCTAVLAWVTRVGYWLSFIVISRDSGCLLRSVLDHQERLQH